MNKSRPTNDNFKFQKRDQKGHFIKGYGKNKIENQASDLSNFIDKLRETKKPLVVEIKSYTYEDIKKAWMAGNDASSRFMSKAKQFEMYWELNK